MDAIADITMLHDKKIVARQFQCQKIHTVIVMIKLK